MRPTITKSQANLLLLAYLFILFGLATIGQPRSLSASEAWWLWVVRDEATVKFTSPGETVRTVLHNTETALERANDGLFILVPYAAVMDVWTTLVGDSSEMGRVFSAFWVMIAFTICWRNIGGWSLLLILIAWVSAQQVGVLSVGFMLLACTIWFVRRAWLYFPVKNARARRRAVNNSFFALAAFHIMLLPLFLPPSDPWETTVQHYLEARHPLEPVIINYAPSSVAGYYDYRYNLRRGVAVDLSWKSFDDAEITTIIDRLTQGGYPIWLVMPDDTLLSVEERADADSPDLIAAFQRTHIIVGILEQKGWKRKETIQVGMMVFYRYERVTMGDVP